MDLFVLHIHIYYIVLIFGNLWHAIYEQIKDLIITYAMLFHWANPLDADGHNYHVLLTYFTMYFQHLISSIRSGLIVTIYHRYLIKATLLCWTYYWIQQLLTAVLIHFSPIFTILGILVNYDKVDMSHDIRYQRNHFGGELCVTSYQIRYNIKLAVIEGEV